MYNSIGAPLIRRNILTRRLTVEHASRRRRGSERDRGRRLDSPPLPPPDPVSLVNQRPENRVIHSFSLSCKKEKIIF